MSPANATFVLSAIVIFAVPSKPTPFIVLDVFNFIVCADSRTLSTHTGGATGPLDATT